MLTLRVLCFGLLIFLLFSLLVGGRALAVLFLYLYAIKDTQRGVPRNVGGDY